LFGIENYIGRKGHVNSAPATGKDKKEEIYSRFFGQSSFTRYSIVDKASVINAKALVRNEEEMKLFAPLGCGFQTGMGAIDNTAQVGENSVLVISGLGSVGLAALMVFLLFTSLDLIPYSQ
jgi:Zn-dependent alcohol dehydrogenase